MIFKKFITLFLLLLITTGQIWSSGIPVKFENEIALNYAKEKLEALGTLKINEGYIYLKVDDRYIFDLLPMLTQDNLETPPYFRSEKSPGAHISVIYETERSLLPPVIPEIGDTFEFTLVDFYSIFIADHKEVYVLVITSPQLEAFRVKYGRTPKLLGHEYHITVAEKQYPEDQVIMKELRFWYNGVWLKYNTRGDKPYYICKGFPDDYKHITERIYVIGGILGNLIIIKFVKDLRMIMFQSPGIISEKWIKTINPMLIE